MSETKETKNRTTLVRGILSGVILLYLLFGLLVTDHLSASQKVKGVSITLNSRGQQNFITEEAVFNELQPLPTDTVFLRDVDFSEMESRLKNVVNIENARVNLTPQGTIKIDITPVIPVARVFDTKGHSYYINRQGKKLVADSRYHVDVPVIMGHIDDSVVTARDLLPLINYINRDTLWNDLTTALKVEKNYDVLLVPRIRGHVVNLGNFHDRDYDNKFDRLFTIYHEVLPHKGWQFYDTISVKFAGQVVATRSIKRSAPAGMLHELVDSEEVDIANMMDDPDTNQ